MFPNKRSQTTAQLTENSLGKRRRIDVQVNETSDVCAELQALRDRNAQLEQELRVRSDALQRAHDRIQCSICKDAIRNPYTMECGHAACIRRLKSRFIQPHRERPSHEREEIVSTDDESDDEGSSGTFVPRPSVEDLSFVHTARHSDSLASQAQSPSRFRSQVSRHPRRRFRSVIYRRKECSLRHVIDAIQPLSSKAETEQDARWGRRGDAWRGVFPPDDEDDEYIWTPPRRNEALPSIRTHSTPPITTSPPFPPREAHRRRTERRLHPYPVADAASQMRPRVWRRWEGGNSGANVSTRSRNVVISRLLAPGDILLPPPAPFIDRTKATTDAIASPPLPHLTDLFASPVPTSGISAPFSDISSPAVETVLHSQPTIIEILQILRPNPNRGLDNASYRSQNDLKEKNGMREPEPDVETEDHDSDDDDENLELIHAMLHGEGTGARPTTDSFDAERYPVYIEEFEQQIGRDGENIWIGADLED